MDTCNGRVDSGVADSGAQQSPSQHGLHVTSAVHNQVNHDFGVSDAVDHAVRLEARSNKNSPEGLFLFDGGGQLTSFRLA